MTLPTMPVTSSTVPESVALAAGVRAAAVDEAAGDFATVVGDAAAVGDADDFELPPQLQAMAAAAINARTMNVRMGPRYRIGAPVANGRRSMRTTTAG
jgi:hypothetical protein